MEDKQFLYLVIAFFLLLSFSASVSAVQSTQQTNRIFLNPFYTDTLNANQNYTFNVSVNPPDNIKSVTSAILTFNVWVSASVRFNLWVNNKTCNNAYYQVYTTSSSGIPAAITFDCSNIITKAGTYIITLNPSGTAIFYQMQQPEVNIANGAAYSNDFAFAYHSGITKAQFLISASGSGNTFVPYFNGLNFSTITGTSSQTTYIINLTSSNFQSAESQSFAVKSTSGTPHVYWVAINVTYAPVNAVTSWLDLTYMNNPSAITLHGTEYQSGDPAKIWLQLLDSSQQAINNATCFLTIYQPNNQPLLQNIQMTNGPSGIYYYDFYAPDVIGVYPAVADCYYVATVSNGAAINYSLAVNGNITGNLTSLLVNDGNRWKLQEGVNALDNHVMDFNVTIGGLSDTNLETNLVIGMRARWNGLIDEELYMKIWNYTSNSWIDLPNTFSASRGLDIDWSNSLNIPLGSNASAMGLIKNGQAIIRVVDSTILEANFNDAGSTLELDSAWMNIISQTSGNVWQEIKGSSEVHVQSGTGHLYDWVTLCGDRTSGCAIFTPDANLFEGNIVENITIKNTYQKSLSDNLEYDTALGLDCTGILSIKEYYDDGQILDVTNQASYNIGSQENCKIGLPISLETVDKSIVISITMDNYPKWEVQWAKNVVDGLVPTINDYCNNVADNLGLSYTVPLQGAPASNDSEYNYCARAMDDIWYFNNNYINSQNETNIGDYLSYLSESRFYYPIIYDHYTKIKQDLTPPSNGLLKLSGTEYSPGDPATVFLQLIDNQGNPITSNAACYLDMYSPLSSGHSQLLTNAPMSSLGGNDGLYYYDIVAPPTLGVYMMSAKCSYDNSLQQNWVYDPLGLNYPTQTVLNGTYTGSELSLISDTDGQYQQCTAYSQNYSSGTRPYTLTFIPSYQFTSEVNISAPNASAVNGVSAGLSINDNSNPDGIRVLYSFDQNPASYTAARYVYDLSGNNNPLWMGSSNVWMFGGISGNAYQWQGAVNNYGQAVRSQDTRGALNFTTNLFTLSVWVNAQSWADASAVVVGEYINATSGWKLYHTGTNLLTFVYADSGGTSRTVSTTALSTSTWYNIVVRENSTTLSIWVNGLQNASTASTLPFRNTTQDLWVGSTAGTATADTWVGYIDELTIWNRSLSNSEIANLYNFTQQRFSTGGYQIYNNLNVSGNNLNITLDDCAQNILGVSLGVQVGVNNGSGYNYGTSYFYNLAPGFTIHGCTVSNVTFIGDPTNVSLKFTWASNTGYTTPVIYNNFTVTNTNTYINYLNQICSAYYDFNTSIIGVNLSQVTSANLYYGGESTGTNPINFSVWNWTSNSWIPLPNVLTFHSTAVTGVSIDAFPSGVDEYITNAISNPSTVSSNGIIRIQASSFTQNSTDNFIRFDNWLNLNLVSTLGTVQTLRGSSEMHVTNIPNATVNLIWNYSGIISNNILNQITASIWNATNRNLTYYPSIDYNQIALNVWNATNRNLTFYQDVMNYTYAAQIVWTYVSRNLTYTSDPTNYNLIQTLVWNATNRSLTFYPDLTNYTNVAYVVWNYDQNINSNLTNQISQSVWNYSIRNLTYTPDMTNYVLIQTLVWNATNRNLTYYQDVMNYTLDAQNIWNYVARNLTYYPAQVDLTNYTNIANVVWNATTRNLTFYPMQTDMTNYSLIQTMVWNATDRNLTFYPQQVDLTNYTQIQNVVWDASNRSLTLYVDMTNYSLINQGVWNYTNRNLTYYPIQLDLTNYTLIQNVVWNATTRNLTYYPAQVDLTNYNLIQAMVWNSTDRNLTYYPAQIDLTNYTQIQSVVWDAVNRTLTFYPDMTNYSEISGLINSSLNSIIVKVDVNAIANAVWNVTNRNLTYYPTQQDLTNYSLISQMVWSYISRNLTYTPDLTNYNLIQTLVWNATDRNLTYYLTSDLNYTLMGQTVWDFANRNLTYYEINNITPQDIWSFATRNLTYYPVQQDLTNYTQITQDIWSYNNRTLTYYQVNNITPADIWAYSNRNLTQDIPQDVWLYYNRTLTYYPTQQDLTNYTLIGNTIWEYANRSLTENIPLEVWTYNNRNLTQDISLDVWTYYNRTLTFYPDVTNYSLINEGVWSYNNRSLNSVVQIDLDLNAIANAVWNSTNRNLTYYPSQEDLTNYSLIANVVWSYINRNLTFYPEQIDLTNYTQIQNVVWNSSVRTLTLYPDMTNYNLIQTLVWNSTDRNLTYYPSQIDLTNYTEIQNVVWSASNRSLTLYVDMTNYSDIANSVWNATNRNLTYYPMQIDLTNYTEIQNVVWTSANRSLTLYEDITNYPLIQSLVWNATDRNLTYYPVQYDLTNYSEIQNVVWNAANRTLTFYPNQEDLTNYTLIGQMINASISPINYTQIAENVWIYPIRNLTFTADVTNYEQIWVGVWNATERNLTYYPAQVDMTNYNLIQQMTWNATDRNLTYYPSQQDFTNYTLIQALVWNATDRNLTYYPAQIDLTNYSQIWIGVWNYTTRDLTYYPLQVDMTNYSLISGLINSSLSYYMNLTDISNAVWAAANRNLTFYPEQLDLTNYTLLTQMVWTYINRNLTYYPTQLDLTNYTYVSDVVWNASNKTLTFYPDLTNYNLIQSLVWNASDRNLTYYPSQTDLTNYTEIQNVVWNAPNRSLTLYVDMTNYSDIANYVWNATDRNLTYYPVQYDLTNYTEIQSVVWNATTRDLTFYPDMTNYSLINSGVWNYTNRNLTFYPEQVDLTNYSNIASVVWNATDRTLTFYPDMTNYSEIQNVVWNAANRTLTFYQDVTNYSQIAAMVWSYVDRNLTYIPDLTNYNLIQTLVWNATDRNLTYYPIQADMTNYTLITEMVWSYINRNLTFYPDQQDLTNYSEIELVVWNSANRSLTYYPVVDNYTEIAQQVWLNPDRNLTYTPDMTNYNTIWMGVWNYTDRNLTYYQVNNLTADDIWNYVNRTLTTSVIVDVNAIANAVWNATDRNLTYYPIQYDLTNYTLIGQTVWNFDNRNLTYYEINNITPGDVWNYVDRNLTYYEHIDMTNYSLINEGVWSFNNRTLTYYEVNNITPDDIWNYANRSLTENVSEEVWTYYNKTLTYYPAQMDLTNYSYISDVVWQYANRSLTENIPLEVWTYSDRNLTQNISMDVWTYYNRTLTFTPDVTDYNLISSVVWNATDRNLTYYPPQEDLTNYTQAAETVWTYSGGGGRSLTYYQDVTNYSKVAESVWNAANRTLTFYQVNNLSAEEIWNYMNRSLTENVSEEVWTYYNKTLTYYPYNNISVEDIWSYVNRSLTENIPFEVWSYSDRNLTQNISMEVWTYYNRTLTYFPPITLDQNSSIQLISDIWNATDRNLTFYPDMTNYSQITQNVWDYNGTISNNILSSFANAVWNLFNSYNFIQLITTSVWNNTDRNLTYYEASNATSVAEIWAFENRTLTEGAFNSTEFVNYVNFTKTVGQIRDFQTVFIGATEYVSGDNGQVALRLIRGSGSLTQYETGALCNITILYPDTSMFINNTPMSEYGEGVYYYPFIVPSTLGVYPYYTNCYIEDRKYYSLDTFHVYSPNNTAVAASIWNATDRNLTYYPSGNNLTANDVWTNPDRNLTYYPTSNVTLTNESAAAVAGAVWGYDGTVSQNLITSFTDPIICKIDKLWYQLNQWGVYIC